MSPKLLNFAILYTLGEAEQSPQIWSKRFHLSELPKEGFSTLNPPLHGAVLYNTVLEICVLSPLKPGIQGISLAKTGLYYKLRYVIGGDHQTLLLLDVDDFFALLMILRIYIVLIFGSPLLLPCPVGQSYSIYNIKLTKWLDVYC